MKFYRLTFKLTQFVFQTSEVTKVFSCIVCQKVFASFLSANACARMHTHSYECQVTYSDEVTVKVTSVMTVIVTVVMAVAVVIVFVGTVLIPVVVKFIGTVQ